MHHADGVFWCQHFGFHRNKMLSSMAEKRPGNSPDIGSGHCPRAGIQTWRRGAAYSCRTRMGWLGILGAIIVLRGVLTFLIHWEIKNEEQAIAQGREAEKI